MPNKLPRPRLAIVVNSVVPGSGVANVARAQAIGLTQYFDIELLCANGSIEHPQINITHVKHLELYWLRRFGHVVREFMFCRRLSKALAQIQAINPVDFVLFHSHTSAALSVRKNLHGCPHGAVIHGDIFNRPKGTYDPLLTHLYKWASKKVNRTADMIVALAPGMHASLLQYGVKAEQIEVIPNGLGQSWLEPSTRAFDTHRANKILMIGRLSVEKDPLTLIRAMKLVASHPQSSSATLNIVGDGPLREACVKLIAELELKDTVKMLGITDAAQVKQLYCEHDILCVPSVSDPLPTVILEAMSQELAVVGADTDGIPHMVLNDQTGLIVTPNQPAELAQALIKLISAPATVREYGKNGRDRMVAEFTLETSCAKLFNAINKRIDSFNKH